ncbi:MAG: hypothetical protein ACRET0_11615 [Steroidobacteraceae bacterium]
MSAATVALVLVDDVAMGRAIAAGGFARVLGMFLPEGLVLAAPRLAAALFKGRILFFDGAAGLVLRAAQGVALRGRGVAAREVATRCDESVRWLGY